MTEMVAGVDEAGVCPIAGPIVAAAVILNPAKRIYKLRDSKILTAQQREALFAKINARAFDVSVGMTTVAEIDHLNIFHATMLAMARAINGLKIKPSLVLIDGRAAPKIDVPTKTIVGGDRTVKLISAASIIAKVTRDQIMRDFHQQFPNYSFDKHKGYPTKAHQAALKKFGVSSIHRRSFYRVKLQLVTNQNAYAIEE